MALLVATLVGAYLPLGRFNLVLALGIAVAKAALVVVFFMQLKRPDPLLRLAAFAGLIFLAFMFTLTYADVLTRAAPTQPGTVHAAQHPGHAHHRAAGLLMDGTGVPLAPPPAGDRAAAAGAGSAGAGRRAWAAAGGRGAAARRPRIPRRCRSAQAPRKPQSSALRRSGWPGTRMARARC